MITIDTELAWRHFAAGLNIDAIYERSIEPAGVGVGHQLETLARHGLKACFFVDPMPALVFGIDPLRRVVDTILDAGQEVQLHMHPQWRAVSDAGPGGLDWFELIEFGEAEQRDMIAQARDLLIAAGAPNPIAFRAGSYAANADTLRALATLGIAFDSSHNGNDHPWPSAIDLPRRQIAPVRHHGVIEIPVSLIEDRPGRLRHFQVCAISNREMRVALDHAIDDAHPMVCIVSHSFELATRDGLRPNKAVAARFDRLCADLAERADVAPTQHFTDLARIPLAAGAQPVRSHGIRTLGRMAEQLWANVVHERKM